MLKRAVNVCVIIGIVCLLYDLGFCVVDLVYSHNNNISWMEVISKDQGLLLTIWAIGVVLVGGGVAVDYVVRGKSRN